MALQIALRSSLGQMLFVVATASPARAVPPRSEPFCAEPQNRRVELSISFKLLTDPAEARSGREVMPVC
jgi:hypothetical protein